MNSDDFLGVLVIEDDADTRANFCDILELDGHRVYVAAGVAEAFVPRDWSAIDVVIVDRRLPDGTAEQLLPRLRIAAPQASVIVATGFADVAGAITALRHGAADYLLKPVQADLLRATLTRIVERRRMERERRRHEMAFRAVIETSPCIIVIMRFDYRIVYFSPFAEEATGHSAAEVSGQDFRKIILQGQEGEALAGHLRLLGEGVPVRDCESRIHCRDGSYRSIMWNADRIDDYGGEPAILITALDITMRKRAEERALQSQRLAAIGEAMAGLIHESRNALQRSRACLEMLALEVEDRPEALDLVSRTQRAQEELQRLYEEVRQYAAPLQLRRESTNLCDLWREVWRDLASFREGQGITLNEECDGVDLHCRVDRFAVAQVWRNILENAVQVSPRGGQITIRGTETEIDGRPAARIAFCDQGPGLNGEQRTRIFEPFFTTKSKGTGLGMAIAQRIIDAHGGRISASESAVEGAEIVVVLPREGV